MNIRMIPLAIAVGLYATDALSQSAVSDEQLLNEIASQTQPGSDPAIPELRIDGGDNLSVDLSDREKEIIASKREAIVQYLYEQQELSDLRSILRESQRRETVEQSIRQETLLTPEEILMFRHMLSDVARAENAPLASPPELQMRTVDLNVDAQEPLEVRVARGYSSSIVFFDETGAPWPLQSGVDALGDESAFAARTVSEQGHVATFQVLKEFSQSNALVVLEGLPVPVVLRLVGSSDTVDSRLSIRIPRPGPNAEVQAVYRNELDNAPSQMIDFLNGERISGATTYALNGVSGEVQRQGQVIYLRTRAQLLNPPPIRSLVSATGYNVYQIPPVTHLLMSVNGEMREATIESMFNPSLDFEPNLFDQE